MTSRMIETDADLQRVHRDRYNRVFMHLYELLRDISHTIGNVVESASQD